MGWPAGMGGTFKGIYDLRRNRLFQRAPDATGAYEGGKADLSGLDDPRLEELVTPEIRSEEHTSELQSLMRISYAVFCLKKKKNTTSKETVSQYKKQNEQIYCKK